MGNTPRSKLNHLTRSGISSARGWPQATTTKPKWQETQAHRFASALLMPAEEVADALPRRDDELRAAEQLARTWGVSMQAALMRARDLGLLRVDDHQRAMRRLARAGWRTREPVEVGSPERPTMLSAAVARCIASSGDNTDARGRRHRPACRQAQPDDQPPGGVR